MESKKDPLPHATPEDAASIEEALNPENGCIPTTMCVRSKRRVWRKNAVHPRIRP